MIKIKITLINSLSLGIILLIINTIIKLKSSSTRIRQNTIEKIFENTNSKYIVDIKLLGEGDDENSIGEKSLQDQSCENVFPGYQQINLLAYIEYSKACLCTFDYSDTAYLFNNTLQPDRNINYYYKYYIDNEADYLSNYEFSSVKETKIPKEIIITEKQVKEICEKRETKTQTMNELELIHCKPVYPISNKINNINGRKLCVKYSKNSFIDIYNSFINYLIKRGEIDYEYMIKTFLKTPVKSLFLESGETEKYNLDLSIFLKEEFKLESEALVFISVIDQITFNELKKDKLLKNYQAGLNTDLSKNAENEHNDGNKLSDVDEENGFSYFKLNSEQYLIFKTLNDVKNSLQLVFTNNLITNIYYLESNSHEEIYKNLLSEISTLVKSHLSTKVINSEFKLTMEEKDVSVNLAYSTYNLCLNVPGISSYLSVKDFSFDVRLYIILGLEVGFYIFFIISLTNQAKLENVNYWTFYLPLVLEASIQITLLCLMGIFVFMYPSQFRSQYFELLYVCPKVQDSLFEKNISIFNSNTYINSILQLIKTLLFCWLVYDLIRRKGIIENEIEKKNVKVELRDISELNDEINETLDAVEELKQDNSNLSNDEIVKSNNIEKSVADNLNEVENNEKDNNKDNKESESQDAEKEMSNNENENDNDNDNENEDDSMVNLSLSNNPYTIN